jgi:hypothetical protein
MLKGRAKFGIAVDSPVGPLFPTDLVYQIFWVGCGGGGEASILIRMANSVQRACCCCRMLPCPCARCCR